MHPVTYQKMSDCINFRRSVANCSRCGGTGKYSKVANKIGSRYGEHCFQCGSAYKLPKKWRQMTPTEIATLISFSDGTVAPLKFLKQLLDVQILTKKRYEQVVEVIENSE